MDSSLSRRRKLLVLASLLRISESLCCTSGWSMTWTLPWVAMVFFLENGSVACNLQGRQAVAMTLRQHAAGGPGAAFQDAGERQPVFIEVQQPAHRARHVVH